MLDYIRLAGRRMPNSTEPTRREPLFSRATLLVVSLLAWTCVVAVTSLQSAGQSLSTMLLPVALLTLVVVLPVGEFVRCRCRLSLRTML